MKIHQVTQGTPEWLALRLGIPTASEFDALVSPGFEIRKGKGPSSYLARKLAEKWLGRPLATFSGGSMEQGAIKESEAITAYEFMTGETVRRVGFITTDDGRKGCSPDGILPAEGLECKCPEAHTHTAYLLDGILPLDYTAQVHGSMLVTGFKRWKFLSYCRGFPPLVLTVERNEEAIEAIQKALDSFLLRFDEGWNMLLELNGGPPPDPMADEVRTMPGLDPETLEPIGDAAAKAAYLDFLKG